MNFAMTKRLDRDMTSGSIWSPETDLWFGADGALTREEVRQIGALVGAGLASWNWDEEDWARPVFSAKRDDSMVDGAPCLVDRDGGEHGLVLT